MLLIIWVVIFRVSVERFWKVFWTMGMMRASDGVLMKWINFVLSRVCKYFWVFLEGFVRVFSRIGVMVVCLNRRGWFV